MTLPRGKSRSSCEDKQKLRSRCLFFGRKSEWQVVFLIIETFARMDSATAATATATTATAVPAPENGGSVVVEPAGVEVSGMSGFCFR